MLALIGPDRYRTHRARFDANVAFRAGVLVELDSPFVQIDGGERAYSHARAA
jgi:hypothetical protein